MLGLKNGAGVEAWRRNVRTGRTSTGQMWQEFVCSETVAVEQVGKNVQTCSRVAHP